MPFTSSWAIRFLALAPGLVLGAPSALIARQRPLPGIECDTLIRPNFDDCQSIISGNTYFGEGDVDPSVCVNPRVCRVWKEGNCRISFCNNEDFEVCYAGSRWGGRTKDIIDFCQPTEQGGYQSPAEPEPWTEVAVRSDQEWRKLSEAADGGVSYEEMSVAQNSAQVKQIEASAAAKAEPGVQARQADDFVIGNRRLNVERPGAAYEVTGPLPNGATFTASETETVSVGITASVTLGGTLFEVMTASIGISVTSEYSVSSSTSVSFTIECEGNQEGVVAWRPLFDYYEGTFEPSGESGYIWVPLDTDPSRSNYDYRCIG